MMALVKQPLPKSDLLLEAVQEQLGTNRRPLLIALDGANGIGKSSLASWLAWQLGMPAVHLDFYIVRNSSPLKWRHEELERIISLRIDNKMPIIIEGILILDAVDQIDRKVDFLVWVRGGADSGLSDMLNDYRDRRFPETNAQFALDGYDERRETMEYIHQRERGD